MKSWSWCCHSSDRNSEWSSAKHLAKSICWERQGKMPLQGAKLSAAFVSAFNLPLSATLTFSYSAKNWVSSSVLEWERAQKQSKSKNLYHLGMKGAGCQCQCLPDLRSHFPEWQAGWKFLGKQCGAEVNTDCTVPKANVISTGLCNFMAVAFIIHSFFKYLCRN